MCSLDSSPGPAALRVIHLLKEHLPYSCPWIYRQMVGPPGVEASALARRVTSTGRLHFPLPRLRSVRDESLLCYALAHLPGRLGTKALTHAAIPVLASVDPALAHGHFGHHSWRYLPALKSLGIPLVASFYGHDMSELPRQKPIWREHYSELFEYGRLFLCEGPAMACALAALGCPAHKIRIQRLGIDCCSTVPTVRQFQPGETMKVLAVARFTEKKGLPDAIRAVALARNSARLELTIVGDPAPGSNGRREKRRIKAALQECGVEDTVRFLGRVPHSPLLELAHQFHVLIQPSRTSSTGDSEGGAPVTLIELGAGGLPAVATRHADIPVVVVEGKTGLLAAEANVEQLAAALVRLASEPGLLARLSAGMAEHIRAEFDQDTWSSCLRKYYEEALA